MKHILTMTLMCAVFAGCMADTSAQSEDDVVDVDVTAQALGTRCSRLTCGPGYTKVQVSSTNCVCQDVNECLTNNGGCVNRQCVNSTGSFSCGTCYSGYAVSNATTCVDINECATNNGGCGANRLCTNTAGGFTCGACTAGYQDVGGVCQDINECAANACGAHRACTNTAGSYTCGSCLSGYQDVSGVCQDINECNNGTNGNCDPYAQCVNTDGSYYCGDCLPGFVRSGATSCVDVDECATNNGGCGPHRACINAIGYFQCGSCDPGYVLDSGANQCVQQSNCTLAGVSFITDLPNGSPFLSLGSSDLNTVDRFYSRFDLVSTANVPGATVNTLVFHVFNTVHQVPETAMDLVDSSANVYHGTVVGEYVTFTGLAIPVQTAQQQFSLYGNLGGTVAYGDAIRVIADSSTSSTGVCQTQAYFINMAFVGQ